MVQFQLLILGDPGSGYRTGITTYYITIDNAEISGSGALGIAYPDAVTGIITGVGIVTSGSGYVYNGTSSTLTSDIAELDPDGTLVSVASTSEFEYFRGQLVEANHPGYVLINSEIIKYTGIDVGTGSLTGSVRGLLGTTGSAHTTGDTVTKYEYNYILKFDDPSPYDNIPLTGSAAGIGASVTLKVDEFGEISDLIFTNRGYNYKSWRNS